MASLLDYDESDREERSRMQQKMGSVIAGVRTMNDATLWRFLRSLAYAANQGPNFNHVPIDMASHFVIEHFSGPNSRPPVTDAPMAAPPPPAASLAPGSSASP